MYCSMPLKFQVYALDNVKQIISFWKRNAASSDMYDLNKIYHHRWSNMIIYTSYLSFVRSDTLYIIRYITYIHIYIGVATNVCRIIFFYIYVYMSRDVDVERMARGTNGGLTPCMPKQRQIKELLLVGDRRKRRRPGGDQDQPVRRRRCTWTH
jgi:hypothetical protein